MEKKHKRWESGYVTQAALQLLSSSDSRVSATGVAGLQVYASAPSLKPTLLPDMISQTCNTST